MLIKNENVLFESLKGDSKMSFLRYALRPARVNITKMLFYCFLFTDLYFYSIPKSYTIKLLILQECMLCLGVVVDFGVSAVVLV